MTTSCEKIYEEYRSADFTNRLHIYLQFPELRNAFTEIDQKETKTAFFKTANHPDKGRKRLGRIINRSFYFLDEATSQQLGRVLHMNPSKPAVY